MHRYAPDREYIDIYLTAENWEGDITNKEPEKCGELKWYSIKTYPDNLIPEVKLAFQKINEKKFYGEFGW